MGFLLVLIFVVSSCSLPAAFGYVFGTNEERIQRLLTKWAGSIDCRMTDCYPTDVVSYLKLVHSNDNTHVAYHAWLTDRDGLQYHAIVVLRSFWHVLRISDVQWAEFNHEPVRTDVVHRFEFDEYFDRG